MRAEREKFKRLSGKLTRAEEELAEARRQLDENDQTTVLRSSRAQVAFLQSVIERGERYDVETMWDLANLRGFLDTVEVSDSKVSGIDEAIGRVLDRYPWLEKTNLRPP